MSLFLRSRRNCSAALACLLLAMCVAIPCTGESLPEVSAQPPWVLYGQNDDSEAGYVMYKRRPVGSDYSAYRLEAVVDSPPDLVAVAAVKTIAHPQKNMDKTILRDDAEAIVVYSYIHINVPFISDRDVISRVERFYDPATETHRLTWEATDEGPPPKDGVIRLNHSEGSWTFTPESPDKTRAVYVTHTEIAGSMPPWLVNSTMSGTLVEGIESLRETVDRERQGL